MSRDAAGGLLRAMPKAAVASRLYTYHRNSAGERVRIALALKRVTYEYVSAPSLGMDAYRAINAQGLLPALEIGGTVIAQSMAILEYLEETYPDPPLLPRDAALRGRVRAFAHLIAADIHPLNNLRVRRRLAERHAATEADIQDWYGHWTATGLASLEAQARQAAGLGAYVFGPTPGFADICLVPLLRNARRFGCDLALYPRLLEVDARCQTVNAFAQARAEAQPDFPAA